MNLPLKLLFLFILEVAAQAELNASDPWRRGSPQSQGFSAARLEALRGGLAARELVLLPGIRQERPTYGRAAVLTGSVA